MAYIHPAAVAHRRDLRTRHDAWRFTPQGKMPGWLDPSATRVRLKEAQEEEARAALQAQVTELRASHERARELLAEIKYELAWRRLCRKYGYDPDQPRDELGRWTDAGGGSSAAASDDLAPRGPVLSDGSPDPIRAGDKLANVIPICILGSHGISTDAAGNKSWRAEYICADGFAFWREGLGGKVPGLRRDPRF